MKKENSGRADRSAATVKKQLESPQPSIEGEGHLIEANQWLKIGLSAVEVSAVKQLHQISWKEPSKQRLGKTIRLLFLSALAHDDILRPILHADARDFRESGGFSFDVYLDAIITRKFNLPEQKRLASVAAKGGVR